MTLRVTLLLTLCVIYQTVYTQVATPAKKPLVFADGNLFLGGWIPMGNCSVLGVHPSFGIQGGASIHEVGFGLILEGRALRSGDNYNVLYQGKTTAASNYIGILAGFYVNAKIFEKQDFKMIGIGGWGLDGFNAIAGPPPLNINSRNPFVGVGIILNRGKDYSRYYKLEVVNSFLNYQNEGGTSLSGNSITIRFCFGWRKTWKQFLKDYKRRSGRMSV